MYLRPKSRSLVGLRDEYLERELTVDKQNRVRQNRTHMFILFVASSIIGRPI